MANNAVVFLAGQSISNAVKLTGNTLLAIQFNTLWTTANITFLGSSDGVNFGPIFDSSGNNVTLMVPALVNYMVVTLAPDILATIGKFHWLQIVSGTYGTQVTQPANTNLNLIFGSF
jgi:hypothetical protein